MVKLIFSLLVLGLGCAVAWRFPRPVGYGRCRTSCLRFADFLKKNQQEGGIVNPVQLASQFCITQSFNCQQVKGFSKLVHIYMKAGIPKHRICRFSKICPSGKKIKPSRKHHGNRKTILGKKTKSVKFGFCKACRVVVGAVSFGVKIFNYTEQKTKYFIESLCKLSPLQVQSKVCKVIIDEIDRVFQMILTGVNPGKICTEIGICKNGTSFNKDRTVIEKISKNMLNAPLTGGLPYYMERAIDIQKGLPVVLEKYQTLSEIKRNGVQSNATCRLCLTVTNLISSSIKYANATIEAIEEAIKVICSLEPEPIKGVCNGFLSKIEEIIQYIEKGLSPGDICKTLGFCTKATSEVKQLPEKPFTETKTADFSMCKMCDSIGKIFDEETKDYTIYAKKLRGYMTDVCQNTKKSDVQEKCLTVAPVFAIVEGIVDSMLHPSLCRKIACNKAFELASSILKSGKTTRCDICLYIVKMFTSRIKYFEELVEKSLVEIDKICAHITYKQAASQCHLYVNRTRAAIQAIAKKMNPKTICAALKVCPKKEDPEISLFDNLFNILTAGTAPTCGICKVAIETVQKNKDAKMVKKTLEETCQGIQIGVGKKVCKRLIKHVDTIVGTGEENKSPEAVCKKLKLCEKEVPVMEIFGGMMDGLKDLFADW